MPSETIRVYVAGVDEELNIPDRDARLLFDGLDLGPWIDGNDQLEPQLVLVAVVRMRRALLCGQGVEFARPERIVQDEGRTLMDAGCSAELLIERLGWLEVMATLAQETGQKVVVSDVG